MGLAMTIFAVAPAQGQIAKSDEILAKYEAFRNPNRIDGIEGPGGEIWLKFR